MENPTELPLSFGDWLIIKFLGKGYTSEVYLAEKLGSTEPVVLKVFKAKKDNYIENENRMLSEISHPRIITAKGPSITENLNRLSSNSSVQEKYSAMLLEYAPKGDFVKIVQGLKGLPEDMARFYFLQLVDAIDYLHNTCGICHRDIKPDNILLDNEFNIKLTDFGFATKIELPEKEYEGKSVGTTKYLSPEMLEKMPALLTQADLFALGVTLFTMVNCFLPFGSAASSDRIYSLLKQRKYADFWEYQEEKRSEFFPLEAERECSAEFRDLVNRMLEFDPKLRISMKEIKEHPWCQGRSMDQGRIASLISEIGKRKRVEKNKAF